jgi:uncharacterized protein involved in exopolysaccharide biosynthesis
MVNQQGQAFEDLRNTISDCTRIVHHRWRLAVIALSLVGSAAFWCSQYLPREYTAATMFERRDDVVLQNLIQSKSPYSFEHLKTTLTLDMTGSRALAKAAVRAGLLPPETLAREGALTESERVALDQVLGRYELQTGVKLVHSSPSLDTISLSCTSNDPTVAREFVVAIRDNYIEDTRERIREILYGTKQFFESEIARLQTQLTQAEESLRKGFDDYPGLDPTDLVSVGNRLETLRLQRDTVGQRRSELEAQIAAREQFLTSAAALYANHSASESARSGGVDLTLEKEIATVKGQVVELVTSKRMTMEHPEVRRLLARLDALDELRESLAAGSSDDQLGPLPPAGPVFAEDSLREWEAQRLRVDLELDSLRRQLSVAAQQADDMNDRVDRFARLYDRLIQEGDSLRALRSKQNEGTSELAVWQTHLAQLERVLTAESGERGTQFALIEEPMDEGRPTKPRVASVFLVCSGLGLAAAALLVALAELFDRSFRSVGQVTRALGVPVLECISIIPTPRERRRNLISRLVWTPTLAVLLFGLAVAAGLAYTSLARPMLHQRAMHKLDRLLSAGGAAGGAKLQLCAPQPRVSEPPAATEPGVGPT